jgi:hypothetical protein
VGDHSYRLPAVPGAGPPDVDYIPHQDHSYEDADCLDPDLARADPAAQAPA